MSPVVAARINLSLTIQIGQNKSLINQASIWLWLQENE